MRIVLFCYFLFTTSDVVSRLTDPLPENKAVAKGATRVAFDCTSTPNGLDAIGWNILAVGKSDPEGIANGYSAFAAYRDTYNVSNTGGLTSTLTIKTVNESLAGTYICSESGAATASAQLIVYNADPVCTSNVSSPLYQGQTVQMSCSFSYTANNSSVGVNMVWSNGSSPPVQSPSPVITTTGTLTKAVSTITQTVGFSKTFPVYQCKTSFTVTATTATNDPGYMNTAQPYNSSIDVTYFIPTCTITGADRDNRILFGNSISCYVDANPPPSYRWSNGTGATLSSVKSVTIMNDGQYTCTASNAAGSCTKSITLTAYTTTAPLTTSTTTTITPPTTSSPPVLPPADKSQPSDGLSETNKIIIGVVVGVGGFLIVAAITVIVCCCRKKIKRGEDRVKSESPSAQGPQRQTAISLQTNFENATTYEKLTDSPTQRAQIYTSLQPPGQEENPAMNVEPYETLTDRTAEYEYEHEYGRLRFPLE